MITVFRPLTGAKVEYRFKLNADSILYSFGLLNPESKSLLDPTEISEDDFQELFGNSMRRV